MGVMQRLHDLWHVLRTRSKQPHVPRLWSPSALHLPTTRRRQYYLGQLLQLQFQSGRRLLRVDVYQREVGDPRPAHRAVLCGRQGGDVAPVHLDQSRGGGGVTPSSFVAERTLLIFVSSAVHTTRCILLALSTWARRGRNAFTKPFVARLSGMACSFYSPLTSMACVCDLDLFLVLGAGAHASCARLVQGYADHVSPPVGVPPGDDLIYTELAHDGKNHTFSFDRLGLRYVRRVFPFPFRPSLYTSLFPPPKKKKKWTAYPPSSSRLGSKKARSSTSVRTA